MPARVEKRTFANPAPSFRKRQRMESEMALFMFALAEAISAAPLEKVDLTIPQPCAPQKAESGEILVCADPKGVSPYRIKQPTALPSARVPKAEVRIANGVSAGAEAESADVGGFTSNRAMFRFRLKF